MATTTSRTKVCTNAEDLVWTSDEECDTNNDVEDTFYTKSAEPTADDAEWRSDNDEQQLCNPSSAVLKEPIGSITIPDKLPAKSHTEEESCEANNQDNWFKKEEIGLDETTVDSNTVERAEKANSQDEKVEEAFEKSADLKQSRTSPINTSDLHFLTSINWDPQYAEQLKAFNGKVAKINTLLESLASADHSVQRKLMAMRSLLLQAVDVEVMKQILNQSDLLIKGLDVIFNAFNSKASKLRVMNNGLVGGRRLTGSDERYLLMKMLEFVNSVGILIPNSLQRSYERSSHKESLFKQLLIFSNLNPEVDEISCQRSSNIQSTFQNIVNKIGEDEGEEGYLILAKLTSSQESAGRIQSDFISSLKFDSQTVKKSLFLNNLSSSLKYLARLTIRTKSGKQIDISEEVVKATARDDGESEVNLIEYDHPHTQDQDKPQDSIQQARIIKILDSGHMLAYLGEDYKTQLRNIEERTCDAWIKTKEDDKLSHLKQSQSLIAGSTIMSETHMITWTDEEFRPLHNISSCRGIVLFIQKYGPCPEVYAYFPDIGATGSVPLDCVRPAPGSLESIPPVVFFCKLQGLLPSPELDLMEASVQTLSYLCVQNEEEMVQALPLLPSLLAINKDSITGPVTKIMGSISFNLSLVRSLSNHAEGQQQLIWLVNYVVVFLDKNYSTLEPQVMIKLLNYITTFLDYLDLEITKKLINSNQNVFRKLQNRVASVSGQIDNIFKLLTCGNNHQKEENHRRREMDRMFKAFHGKSRIHRSHSRKESRQPSARDIYYPNRDVNINTQRRSRSNNNRSNNSNRIINSSFQESKGISKKMNDHTHNKGMIKSNHNKTVKHVKTNGSKIFPDFYYSSGGLNGKSHQDHGDSDNNEDVISDSTEEDDIFGVWMKVTDLLTEEEIFSDLVDEHETLKVNPVVTPDTTFANIEVENNGITTIDEILLVNTTPEPLSDKADPKQDFDPNCKDNKVRSSDVNANSDWDKPDINCEHSQIIDGIMIGEEKATTENICNDTFNSIKINTNDTEANTKETEETIDVNIDDLASKVIENVKEVMEKYWNVKEEVLDKDTLNSDFKESWLQQKQQLTECKKYQISKDNDYEINVDDNVDATNVNVYEATTKVDVTNTKIDYDSKVDETKPKIDETNAKVYETNVEETKANIDQTNTKVNKTKAIRKIVPALSMIASKALNNDIPKNKVENLGESLNESAMKHSNAKETSIIAGVFNCNNSNSVPNSNNETKGEELKNSMISKNTDSKDIKDVKNIPKDKEDNDSKVVGAIDTKEDSWLHDDTYKKKLKPVWQGSQLTEKPGFQVESIEHYGNGIREAEILAGHITAMANTGGGKIFIGMKGKGGFVQGTRMSFKDKDNFSLMIDLITSRIIYPRFPSANIHFDFYPVQNRFKEVIPCMTLIKMNVKPVDGRVYITEMNGGPAALYMRKRRGPNHTYQMLDFEAEKMVLDKVNDEKIKTRIINKLKGTTRKE